MKNLKIKMSVSVELIIFSSIRADRRFYWIIVFFRLWDIKFIKSYANNWIKISFKDYLYKINLHCIQEGLKSLLILGMVFNKILNVSDVVIFSLAICLDLNLERWDLNCIYNFFIIIEKLVCFLVLVVAFKAINLFWLYLF